MDTVYGWLTKVLSKDNATQSLSGLTATRRMRWNFHCRLRKIKMDQRKLNDSANTLVDMAKVYERLRSINSSWIRGSLFFIFARIQCPYSTTLTFSTKVVIIWLWCLLVDELTIVVNLAIEAMQNAWFGTRSRVRCEEVWGEARPLSRKKMNISLEMACFGEFWSVFLCGNLGTICVSVSHPNCGRLFSPQIKSNQRKFYRW